MGLLRRRERRRCATPGCEHGWVSHRHYRAGSDCSACSCRAWRSRLFLRPAIERVIREAQRESART